MSLALSYIYLVAALGLIGIPLVVGKEYTFKGGEMAVIILMNLVEAGAVYSLWRSSSFETRTPLFIGLLVLIVFYIFYMISLVNKTIFYTTLRGMISAATGIATVIGVSFLAFG